MTLQDISHGPGWAIWIAAAVCAVLSLILLSGHGTGLIAGYNTAPPEKKAQYDEKKLCRVTGAGLAFITVLLAVMGLGQAVLPAACAWVFMLLILAVCVGTVILKNTVCRKRS